MIFATGDTHSDVRRLNLEIFPEQRDMTKEDFVIILGDFGLIWDKEQSKTESYWLKWLNRKSFTTLFIDGNHENFDRLNAYPEIDFHGGRAHQISDSVYHLMRGHVFELQGKKFFAFGGAASHDIDDGILDPADYDHAEFMRIYKKWWAQNKMFRIKGMSWWPQEMPDQIEMDRGIENLGKHNNTVDFVLTHCAPQQVVSLMMHGGGKPDSLTMYFNDIAETVEYTHWLHGHYHVNAQILGKFICLYEQIVQIA